MNSILTVSVPINFGQKKPGVSLGAKELYESYFSNYDKIRFLFTRTANVFFL